MKITCLYILFFKLFISALYAQNIESKFKHYSSLDGLPSRTITSICQDKHGFVWIATFSGLVRFDGISFENYIVDSTLHKTIHHREINSVFCDSKNNIWVANNGLNLLNRKNKTFITYKNEKNDTNSLGNNLVKDIIEDSKGNIWLGHYDGVSRLDFATGKFRNYKFPEVFVNSITEDKEGNIWIGTFWKGVFKINLKNNNTVNYTHNRSDIHSIGSHNIKDIICDKEGNIWLATWGGGINLYNPTSNNFIRYVQNDQRIEHNSNNINALFIDKNNQFWVGTDNGIYFFNRETTLFRSVKVNERNSVSKKENVINTISDDNCGNIWISTYDGILYYNQLANNFQNYKINDDLYLNNQVLNIFEASENTYYLSHQTGYYSWKMSDNTFLNKTGKEIIYKDKNQCFWYLSNNELHISKPNNIDFSAHKYSAAKNTNGILSNNISSIVNDTAGNFWIKYDSAFFYSIIDKEKKTIKHIPLVNFSNSVRKNDAVTTLGIDKNNQVWSSFWNILYKYDISNHTIKVYESIKNGLSSPTFFNCVTDKNNNVWFSTLTGLDMYNSKTDSFYTFNNDDGFPDNNIFQIIEDNNKLFWLITSLSITNFNPYTYELKIFDKNDNLPYTNFIKGTLTSDGKIVLYSHKMITIFDPAKIKKNTFVPPIYITRLKLFNSEVKIRKGSILETDISLSKEITLNYDQTNITIEFTSLNYLNPEKNQYACRLEEVNKKNSKWIQLGTTNKISYNNIEPGTYIFNVIGSNNDNVWNSKGASLRINVLPPFWKTWWFKLVSAIILILVVMAIFWGRLALLEKQKSHLEELVQERTQEITMQTNELKILNSTKDKLFAIIGHDLKNPFQAILGSISQLSDIEYDVEINKKRHLLKIIGDSVRNAAEILENLISWAGSHTRLISYVPEVFSLIQIFEQNLNLLKVNADKKNIRFDMHVPANIFIHADKNMFSTIIRNLLGNAIKFSYEAGMIKIAANHIDNKCIINIIDNGVGIGKEKLNKIFHVNNSPPILGTAGEKGTGLGLVICKEFIEKNNGTISVLSEPGKGSTFTISLKAEIRAIEKTEYISSSINSSEQSPIDEEESKLNATFLKKIKKEDFLILVVEDNYEIRQNILMLLNKYFKTEYADNGKIGIEKAFEIIPDVIISDVMMPEMDGYELCRILKSDMRTSHIPIILLTARSEEKSQLSGIYYGADHYLTKPFLPKILVVRIINSIMQRKILRDKFSKEFILQPSDIPVSGSETEFLNLAIKIVENNIDFIDFSVEQFSQQMGLSYMQLYRKMSSITGQTPLLFVRTIRLKRAAQLIEKTDLNINEIALSVGFNDPSYFSKCFKEEFNVLPKQYLLKKKKIN